MCCSYNYRCWKRVYLGQRVHVSEIVGIVVRRFLLPFSSVLPFVSRRSAEVGRVPFRIGSVAERGTLRRVFHHLKGVLTLWIEYHEFWPDFARPSAFQQGHQTAQIFQIQRVTRHRFNRVSEHGAVQPSTSRWWTRHETSQFPRFRHGTSRNFVMKFYSNNIMFFMITFIKWIDNELKRRKGIISLMFYIYFCENLSILLRAYMCVYGEDQNDTLLYWRRGQPLTLLISAAMEVAERSIPSSKMLSQLNETTIGGNLLVCRTCIKHFVVRITFSLAGIKGTKWRWYYLDTHAAWTRAPVATKSRLSLWPHVSADTGHWQW